MPPIWNGDKLREVYHLPPPNNKPISRVPEIEKVMEEDRQTRKENINLNYVSN